jgi:beta-glucosidase
MKKTAIHQIFPFELGITLDRLIKSKHLSKIIFSKPALIMPLFLFLFNHYLLAQPLSAANSSVKSNVDLSLQEKRINGIIQEMTIEEKVAMCLGSEQGPFQGVPRLGIPNMGWTDGPRGPNAGQSTAFPCGVAFGSTWNTDLINKTGVVMGQETRALGRSVLFGPGINILRDPLGGRFFEYYSEDPFLTAQLCAAIVKGIQSQKISACLKHFACNNREDNRNLYMSMVDERTLREIYLPAFKAGVDAGAMTVMTAANGVNGEFASDNHHLLQEILKDEWGFKGFVLTDWVNTRSTEKAAFAGLDVAMPFDRSSLFGAPLLKAVKEGRIPADLIDEKVRRILRVYDFVGLLNQVSPTTGGAINTKDHQMVAKRVAEESMVLLKNENNILPLDRNKIKRIVVLGPNADQRFCLGALGGSSWMEPSYEITALKGIRNVAGDKIEVIYVPTDQISEFRPITAKDMMAQNGEKGFLAKYFNNGDREPAVTRIEKSLNFVWEMRSPDLEKIKPDYFHAEFTGSIIPPVTGTYILKLSADNRALLLGSETPYALCDIDKGIKTATGAVHMEAGKPFPIRLYYNEEAGDAFCNLEWSVPSKNGNNDKKMKEIDATVGSTDVVVFVGGINHSLDTESRDRNDMDFPTAQEELIKHIVSKNPKTIVTLINGSPLTLGGWLNDVPALLEAWYPGMEGGNAIGEILFGDVNPSGRLPFTWPKKLEDVPMYAVKTQNRDRIDYLEGVLIGYRYFETWNVKPEFPFGYGLSYTQFSYDDLKLSSAIISADDSLKVSLKITNTGGCKGSETVQLYVNEPVALVTRPQRELKGFKKVELMQGESRIVNFTLTKSDFSYYDVTNKTWKADTGVFKLEVGSSSHDIKLSETIQYK